MPKLSISCVDGAYTSVSSVVTGSWFLSGQKGTQGVFSEERHVGLYVSSMLLVKVTTSHERTDHGRRLRSLQRT